MNEATAPTQRAMAGPLILIVEDDIQIRRLLRSILTSDGYRFIEASTAQEAIQLTSLQSPDLLLLDLGLPDADGIEVIRQLRQWTNIPVIVLTVTGEEHNKVAVLDAGADDYLTKPFGSSELLARMRVALRRAQNVASGGEEAVFKFDKLKVDLAHRKVFVNDVEIHLSPIEYKLLQVLVKYAGRVVTQQQLLKEVWGPEYLAEAHYLRIYMGQLRRKLEEDSARPNYLITEPGVGYRLKTEP